MNALIHHVWQKLAILLFYWINFKQLPMNRKYIFGLLLWAGCLLGTSLQAQIRWEGLVLNSENGNPIPGVAISVPQASKLFIADDRGRIEVVTASRSDSLLVQALGFIQQKLTAGDLLNQDALLLVPGPLNLETVTITSARQNHLNTISTVDVNLRPVKSSQDVLRMVPGLFIAQHAGGGKAEQIFLRGFDIDHGTDFRIRVDGLPVNMVSHAHGQGYADLHFVIPELVGAVDFGKGPYRSEHGNFTTAGYVDFHTKETLEESQIKVEGGAFNTQRMLAMIDLTPDSGEKKSRSYVAGELLLTDGPFDSPQNFQRLNLFGKTTRELGEDKLLILQASTFSSKWDHSGQIPIRAVDQGTIGRFGAIDDTEGGITGRTDLSAKLLHFLPNGGEVRHQAHFTHYNFLLYSNFTFFLNDSVNGDQIRQREERNIYGYEGRYRKNGVWGDLPQQFEAGWGFRYDEVRDNELSRTVNREETLSRLSLGDVNETNGWFFVDQELQLKRLLISAGLRGDLFRFDYVDRLQTAYQTLSDQGLFVSPKLNLFYDVNEKLQLYAKGGRGFHSNDSRVVVRQSANQTLPAAWGSDLGLIVKPVPRLLVNAAYWYLFLEEEFVYVGDEGIVEPSGRSERQGFEVSARYQLTPWLFADLDLNWTRPRLLDEPEGEDRIPLAPTFTSIGGLTVQTPKGLNTALRYRYMQDRPANEDNSLTAEGYAVVDANINYRFSQFQVGLVIENLLDTDWREAQFETESRLPNEVEPITEVHFTPGTPRWVRGQVSVFF